MTHVKALQNKELGYGTRSKKDTTCFSQTIAVITQLRHIVWT